MTRNPFWGVACALGSGMIGFFADRLDTLAGSLLFALGVALLVLSILHTTRPHRETKE